MSRIKYITRKLGWLPRLLTGRLRMLPDFLIVGAMKSGTTSLYQYLAQHPQLAPSYIKEVCFFSGGMSQKGPHFEKGETWYRAHFALKTNADNHAFEASGYMFHPLAAEKIFATNPAMKIIMLLRNPTERAISHYFHNLGQGRESLPIMDALQVEDDRQMNHSTPPHPSYKRRGLYVQQIERFLRYFPKQQMLILGSEDFLIRPEYIVKQVFEFVGVDAEFEVKDLTPHNVAKNKVTVDPEIRQYLNDYFLPYNNALYKLIDHDFDW